MYDISSTLAHDQLKADGRRLFIETMDDAAGKNVAGQVATDLQTLVESAWNTKGQAAGAIGLSRLVGYLGALAELAGAMTQAGFAFTPCQDQAGKPVMLVKLAPAMPEPEKEEKQEPADIENLSGMEYEQALAKMTPFERAKYVAGA